MNLNEFNHLRQILPNDKFMLCYSGYVSESVLDAIGVTLRDRLSSHVSDEQKVRRVFSIFVELMQNLIRYGLEGPKDEVIPDEDKSGFGLVMIVEEANGLALISGNYIADEDVPSMRERISKVSNKNPEELRELYKEQMRKPPEPQSKGASLGLIEIARRSSEPLESSFVKADDHRHFFMLKAMV